VVFLEAHGAKSLLSVVGVSPGLSGHTNNDEAEEQEKYNSKMRKKMKFSTPN
jgi:hypothetical protein